MELKSFNPKNIASTPTLILGLAVVISFFFIWAYIKLRWPVIVIFLPMLCLFSLVNSRGFWAWNAVYDTDQHKDYGDMIYYLGFASSLISLSFTLFGLGSGSNPDSFAANDSFATYMEKFGWGLILTGLSVILRIITIETAEKAEKDEAEKVKREGDHYAKELQARLNFIESLECLGKRLTGIIPTEMVNLLDVQKARISSFMTSYLSTIENLNNRTKQTLETLSSDSSLANSSTQLSTELEGLILNLKKYSTTINNANETLKSSLVKTEVEGLGKNLEEYRITIKNEVEALKASQNKAAPTFEIAPTEHPTRSKYSWVFYTFIFSSLVLAGYIAHLLITNW